MTKNRSQMPPVPSVGQVIYVPTELHISHGMDDVLGGRATVIKVSKRGHGKGLLHAIEVKEHPNRVYYWENYLAENQEKWKEEYGDQWARPIPDEREEFNSWSIITRDTIRRWLREGKERGATHVIVMFDNYDFTYYPVYVMPGENPREIAEKEAGSQTSVKEVYSLSHDIETQLAENLALHYD